MKPVRLEIEGLTSFRQRQEIDFSGLDLFVITGPTGAGKTSILDAIVLALYGCVPRMGGQGNRELVSHGEALARVKLEFAVGKDRYVIARRLFRDSRRSQPPTFEQWDGVRWVTVLDRGGVGAVTELVERVVGLGYDAFTRAVLLPQGDFAAFLAGKPSDRREILIRLLDLGRYEAVAKLAGSQAASLKAKIDASSHLIAHEFADATDQALAELVGEAEQAARLAEAFANARAEAECAAYALVEIDRRIAEIDRHRSTVMQIIEETARLGRRWSELEPRDDELRAELERANGNLATAADAHRRAVADLAAVVECTGDDSALAKLETACDGVAGCRQSLAELRVRSPTRAPKSLSFRAR